MKRNGHRIPLILCVAFVTAALAASVAAPSENERDRQLEAQRTERVEISPANLERSKVAVDPETGEVVSLLSEKKIEALSAPLANALHRSIEGLQVFELTNGGRGMHLEGRFQHALVARVKEDGSLEIVCVNHSHEAEALLKRRSAEIDLQPLDR